MNQIVQDCMQAGVELRAKLAMDPAFNKAIESSGKKIQEVLDRDGTIFSCGNGGSACDAMHLTEELVARFKRDRRGYKAMHFCDAGTLTCWANDCSFEQVFARQAETFCSKKDLLIAISTSGNSKNVIAAVQSAKKNGCYVVGLLGKDGGKLASLVDMPLIVPSSETERIQEIHITIIHIWLELLES